MTSSNITVSVITDAADIAGAYEVAYACFGKQVPDAILEALNPDWHTPDGYSRAVQRVTKRFRDTEIYDDRGNPISVFLKATAINPDDGRERIVGLAIWLQCSAVKGYGHLLNRDMHAVVEDRYPGNPSEQEYLCVALTNLNKQRNDLVEERSGSSPPAVMALDLCVVHPEYQRRGIATMLVQWGLDEARNRGELVCCMEASPMGRTVYAKLGFKQEGPEIDYQVDGAQFAKNGMPSNIFMRTQSQ